MAQAKQSEDIRGEGLIENKWNFLKANPSDFADGILITGANSFLGTHMIRLLEDKWPGKIQLIVRADSTPEAIKKIGKAYRDFGLGHFNSEKCIIFTGDVCEENLGLKAEDFRKLNENTGFVLHLAMNPVYHLPYAYFQKHWIPELERMIGFCSNREHPKSLHYPSSYNANFFTEDEDFKHLNTNAWQSGYAGFKWVANQVIQNAFVQNLNGCLYDIPLVIGSMQKGICPSHYSIWHILDIFLKTGCYIDFEFKIVPVDALAEVIVSNMLNDLQNKGTRSLRPVLDEPVTHKMLATQMEGVLGLEHVSSARLREACETKRKFDFMFPPNFSTLIKKVDALPAIWPKGFDKKTLPDAQAVFMKNLTHILAWKYQLN